MKTLETFAANNNLTVVKIRYKHGFGYCSRKGFDLINHKNEILLSLEPFTDSDNNKWYVRNAHNNYNGNRYIKRITDKLLTENINVNESSFFRLS